MEARVSERNLLIARNLIADKVPLSRMLQDTLGVNYIPSEGKMRCPVHEDSTPSFHYSDTNKSGNCFGCHIKGSVVEIFMHIQRKTSPNFSQLAAIKALARKYQVELPDLLDSRLADATRVRKSSRERRQYSEQFYREKLKDLPQKGRLLPVQARICLSKELDNVFLGRSTPEACYNFFKDLTRTGRVVE